MTSSSALLIALAATACGADPEGEQVLSRLKEHFSRISSMRVQGTEFTVKSGGLWDANPEASRTTRDLDAKVREFDLWANHPKYRWFWTERTGRTGSVLSVTLTYFDGQMYTYLKPSDRTGLTMKGGALATMPQLSPLHAVGFCFVDTYQTSLATVLCDSPKVAVKRLSAEGGSQWLVEAQGLPKDLRPRDWLEKHRQRVLVKVWLTVEPQQMRVNRWAVYAPVPHRPFYGKPLPAFHLDGHTLEYAFVNVYDKEAKKSGIPVPRRVLLGNGNGTWEILVGEMLINPKEAADTFRPAIPPGYSITKAGEDEMAAVTVTGGEKGSQQRAQGITQQARELLGADEQLRAPTFRWSDWIWPGAGALLVLSGVASFLIAKRRKKA